MISLALIRCNSPSDLEGYSTRSHLVECHCETVQKQRWNPDVMGDHGLTGVMEQYFEDYRYFKSRATLIIAPVSLVGQWEKECDQRADGKVDYQRYYGSNRKRDVRQYVDRDIIFTTYGIMAKEQGTSYVLSFISSMT